MQALPGGPLGEFPVIGLSHNLAPSIGGRGLSSDRCSAAALSDAHRPMRNIEQYRTVENVGLRHPVSVRQKFVKLGKVKFPA